MWHTVRVHYCPDRNMDHVSTSHFCDDSDKIIGEHVRSDTEGGPLVLN